MTSGAPLLLLLLRAKAAWAPTGSARELLTRGGSGGTRVCHAPTGPLLEVLCGMATAQSPLSTVIGTATTPAAGGNTCGVGPSACQPLEEEANTVLVSLNASRSSGLPPLLLVMLTVFEEVCRAVFTAVDGDGLSSESGGEPSAASGDALSVGTTRPPAIVAW